MPSGTSKRSLRGRADVTNLIKKPDLEVHARPTDPFVETKPDFSVSETLSALMKAGQSGLKVAQIAASESAERGALAAQKAPVGGEKPSGEDELWRQAYMSGVDRVWGDRQANDYHTEGWATLVNSLEKSEDDFVKALNEKRAKYLASNVSKESAKAFLAKAARSDEMLVSKFRENKVAKARLDLKADARKNVDVYIRDGINSILAGVGLNIDALQTIEGYDTFEANRPEIMKQLNPFILGAITGHQDRYGGVFNKAEISEMTLETLSGIAAMTGRPEFLNFAFERGADNMAFIHRNDTKGNSFLSTVDTAVSSATDRGHRQYNFLVEQRRKRDKDEFEKSSISILTDASNLWKSPEGVHPQALEDLRKKVDELGIHRGADYNMMVALRLAINTAENRRNHPFQSNIKAKETLAWKYTTGHLNVADVTSRRWELSEGDYDRLLFQAAEQMEQERKRRREGESPYFTDKKNVELGLERIKGYINPRNPISGLYYDRNGWQKAQDAERKYQQLVYEFQENKGRSPQLEELEAIEQKVYQQFERYVKVKEEEIPKIREGMIARGINIRSHADKIRLWGKMTAKEREVADMDYPSTY